MLFYLVEISVILSFSDSPVPACFDYSRNPVLARPSGCVLAGYIGLQSFRSVASEFSTNPTRSRTIGWPWLLHFPVPAGTARGNPSVFRDRNLVRVDAHFRWRQFPPSHSSFRPPSLLFSILLQPVGLCFLFDYDVRSDSRAPEWNCSRSEKCF